ncbi:phage baseplate assembly protein V [Paraburkholderia adhaesiva]|uniref:phage baseplate assembly protein V n=1 Tax=Paraburkholderia adhaesiva TaxID=2883244 RepID=UPI001F3ABDFA|nr:phage baseplate assembly protein V [Paraburkholderia adhaesiva]
MQSQFWSLVRSLGRGRLTRVDDSGPVQLVQMQLSQNETRDSTPRLCDYGFSSNPPAGADAVAVFLAGNRINGVVIACGHQEYRVRNLASGEVCVSDNRGQSVYLSASGIVINGGGLPLKITNTPEITADSPLMHCTGNIECDGNIAAAGDILDNSGTNAQTMAAGRKTYDIHTHDVTQVQGGQSTIKSNPPTPQE